MIGRFNTDNDTDVTMQLFGQEIINLRKAKTNNRTESDANKLDQNQTPSAEKLRLSLTITNNESANDNNREAREKSPTSVKDVKEIILSSSKNILGKVLSPSKDKLGQNLNKKNDAKKPVLMTRRELCDPFGSDEEEEGNEISLDNKIITNGLTEKTAKVGSDDNRNEEENNADSNKTPTDLPLPNSVSALFLHRYQ